MTSRSKILRRLALVLSMTMLATFLSMVAAGSASAVACVNPNDPLNPRIVVPNGGNLSLDHCDISMQSTGGPGGAVENHGTLTLDTVTISGNTAGTDGGGIFNGSDGTLTLTNVVVTGNMAGGFGGGIDNDGGSITMSNVTVTFNTAGSGGGGIANLDGSTVGAGLAVANNTTTAGNGGGILNVNGKFCVTGGDSTTCFGSPGGGNSLVQLNTASSGNGGGIANDGGDLALGDSTVDSNQAGNGGGIWTQSSGAGGTALFNVTISNNTATGNGGGLFNDGGLVCCGFGVYAVNLTISGNKATGGSGGGVYTTGHVEVDPFLGEVVVMGFTLLNSSTIADNTATGSGGGVYNDDSSAGTPPEPFAATEVQNTLLARNGTNCAGTIVSDGSNLDTENTCAFSGSGDQHDVGDDNVGLGTLAPNGGPTQGSSELSAPMMTQALELTSPAVDAGIGGSDCPPTDERSSGRPQDGNHDGMAACDIGAYELSGCRYNLIALSTQGRKSFDFSGTARVEFCGGGVWSNSGAESSNNSVPTQDTTCEAPVFTSSGDWLRQGNLTRAGFIVNEQSEPPIADPLAGVLPPAQPPTCGGNLTSGTVFISGVSCYASIRIGPGGTLNLVGDPARNDNVVYLLGGPNGQSIQGTFSASNVLIYVAKGDVRMNAQAVSNLQPNLTGGPWHGFMLWVAHGNSVRLNGGANSQWTGTIYGPGSHIVVNGGSNSALRTIVIGDTIDFSGNDTAVMYCDGGSNFPAAVINP